MSEENVELHRHAIDAFNNRDLDAFLTLAHPDVVGTARVTAIEGRAYRGHDGIREWWRDMLGVFPDFRIEVVSVRDAGDLTVAKMRASAHGEGSAAPFEAFVWQVLEWRDGLAVRWQTYEQERGALEAAGLSE